MGLPSPALPTVSHPLVEVPGVSAKPQDEALYVPTPYTHTLHFNTAPAPALPSP